MTEPISLREGRRLYEAAIAEMKAGVPSTFNSSVGLFKDWLLTNGPAPLELAEAAVAKGLLDDRSAERMWDRSPSFTQDELSEVEAAEARFRAARARFTP